VLASTLILSIAGIVCIVAGVHGPQVIAGVGDFLLLPNIILLKLGVPIALPLLHHMSITSMLIFLVLQTAYYYVLFRLLLSVTGNLSRKTLS
jgi:hypothetical protein